MSYTIMKDQTILKQIVHRQTDRGKAVGCDPNNSGGWYSLTLTFVSSRGGSCVAKC